MKSKETISSWAVLKRTFEEFIDDKAIKLSASLSYYTIFSIGPLIIIMMSLAGIFFGKEAVQGEVYEQIKQLVGSNAALQIQDVIKNIQMRNTGSTAIIGVIVLIIGASGVFTEIQDSINYIWSVKAKPKRNWLKYLTDRLLSFSLIVVFGFLLMVSLVLNAVSDLFSKQLNNFFPSGVYYLLYAANLVILYSIVTVLFAVIYKILPDARIRWRDAFKGASFTGLLFLIGKFLIGFYIGNSKMSSLYGAAGSFVVILSWIYYTAIILYFGAEFTKVYAFYKGGGISPKETAVFIIKHESKEAQLSALE